MLYNFIKERIQHYSPKKYWNYRKKIEEKKGFKILRLYYLYVIKKMDAFNNASMGTNLDILAHFETPPILPHGLNGIVVNKFSSIGKNVTIFHQVTIGSKDSKTAPSIGNNTIIYPGAKIIGNIHVGNNAIIGAGAVVVKNVPDNAIVAGVPAKVIGENFNNKEKMCLNVKEVQNLQLEILKYFDKFCRDNKLKYFLAGGTMLGAIRHKGFIPWDDDIDVCMPREDYEKLINSTNFETNNFKILETRKSEKFVHLFAKVVNINYVNNDYDKISERYGIDIDIFPIDGLGNNKKKAYKVGKKILKKKKNIYICFSENHKFISKILLKLNINKILYKNLLNKLNKNSFYDSAYVGSIVGGLRELKEIFERRVYDEEIEVTFENYNFLGMKNYDEYLKRMYGEYMKLPSIEARVPPHNIEVIRVKNVKGEF